jgi:hypothetical protein
MVFKNVFAQKLSEKMAVLTQNTASLWNIKYHNSGFQEKRHFSPKIWKHR